jgi:hypothetical protein
MDDGLACPVCDRADFESVQGLNYHHAQTHGGRIVDEDDIVAAIEDVNKRNDGRALSGHATVRDVRDRLTETAPADTVIAEPTLRRYIRRLEDVGRVESGTSLVYGSHGDVKTVTVAGGGSNE